MLIVSSVLHRLGRLKMWAIEWRQTITTHSEKTKSSVCPTANFPNTTTSEHPTFGTHPVPNTPNFEQFEFWTLQVLDAPSSVRPEFWTLQIQTPAQELIVLVPPRHCNFTWWYCSNNEAWSHLGPRVDLARKLLAGPVQGQPLSVSAQRLQAGDVVSRCRERLESWVRGRLVPWVRGRLVPWGRKRLESWGRGRLMQ